ncbi:MAG: CRISPR-associated endonuclease Cas2 [Planctomycetaceae bacterium]
MSRYIATYDVSSDRQRDRLAKLLQRYGERLQLSVFEVWLDADDLEEFRIGVGSLLSGDDEFDLIPVDERPNRVRLRWQRPLQHAAAVVVLQ